MANEIYVNVIHGLTVSVQLYSGATPIGSPISTTEIGTTGSYVGNMPATSYGYYLLIATAVGGDNPVIATGDIFWGGDGEMIVELHELQGMRSGSPMTVTQTSRAVAGISLAISGDGVNTSTVTR